jgi:hypothetical protein
MRWPTKVNTYQIRLPLVVEASGKSLHHPINRSVAPNRSAPALEVIAPPSTPLYGVACQALPFGGSTTYRGLRSARESRTAARRAVILGSAGLDSETRT